MKKIVVSLLILTIICSGCTKKKTTDEDTTYTTVQNEKVKSLEIVDFMVEYEDNISTVYFDIINNSNETVDYKKITYKLYNHSKDLVLEFSSELGQLKSGDTKEIKESFDIDLTNIATVEYELSNE